MSKQHYLIAFEFYYYEVSYVNCIEAFKSNQMIKYANESAKQ